MSDEHSNLPVVNLITEITHALSVRRGPLIVEQTLSCLADMNLTAESIQRLDPCMPTEFIDNFDVAINNMPSQLSALANAIDASKDSIQWNRDLGQFYVKDADIGDSYRNNNMNCILVGKENGLFHSDRLSMGLFFLQPHTFYRDHNHEPSEMYFNLTGPHGFRFNVDGWSDYTADSIIWNLPWLPHATRVYDIPFLSVFVWTGNLDALIQVVNADDWAELQNELLTGSAG